MRAPVVEVGGMSTGLLFWIIMLLLLILGFVAYWPRAGAPYWPMGFSFVVWVLLALLGWKVFGPALHS